jgi:radical SAM protein with 4Fe4S-binding SPASM domain
LALRACFSFSGKPEPLGVLFSNLAKLYQLRSAKSLIALSCLFFSRLLVHGTHPAHPKIDGSELLVNIYQKSPTFLQVRDYAQLKGKCGVCEFKFICGGSRARAYALTGDPMRSDPNCIYQPPAWKKKRSVMDRQPEGDDRRVYM